MVIPNGFRFFVLNLCPDVSELKPHRFVKQKKYEDSESNWYNDKKMIENVFFLRQILRGYSPSVFS